MVSKIFALKENVFSVVKRGSLPAIKVKNVTEPIRVSLQECKVNFWACFSKWKCLFNLMCEKGIQSSESFKLKRKKFI